MVIAGSILASSLDTGREGQDNCAFWAYHHIASLLGLAADFLISVIALIAAARDGVSTISVGLLLWACHCCTHVSWCAAYMEVYILTIYVLAGNGAINVTGIVPLSETEWAREGRAFSLQGAAHFVV
jgi:hypothetical protein